MVSLAPPFILCPLAESKGLLGFSEGATENRVVLTLGKNIAILYSVPDQKQELSWTTSRHWFTSKVVYCKDLQKYGAIMDENSVWIWDEKDTTLANATKFRFPLKLHALVPTESSGTLLLFQDGFVLPYSRAVTERRNNKEFKELFNATQWRILDYKVDENSNKLYLIVGQAGGRKLLSKCGREKEKMVKIYISTVPFAGARLDDDETGKTDIQEHTVACGSDRIMLGWTLMLTDSESSLLYLSCDGFLYKYVLESNEVDSIKANHEPLKLVVFDKYISLTNPVVLFQHDENSIICYGSDAAEEGSVVLVYDVKFDLILCRQPLKLYSFPPIVAKLGSSVFVPLGMNILVVGVRSNKTLLSSVVGRHKLQQLDFYETKNPWKDGWEGSKAADLEEKFKVKTQIEDLEPANEETFGVDLEDLQGIAESLAQNGHPEALICSQIVPQAIEAKLKKRSVVAWLLNYFTDIPEKYLLMMILYLLPEDGVMESEDKEPMSRLLRKSFDQRAMVGSIRQVEFPLAKKLIAMLLEFLQNVGMCNSGDIANLIQWLKSVVDGQYTNFVFNNETESVDAMLKLISDKLAFFDEVASFTPVVEMIVNSKTYQARPNTCSNYRIEKVVFT